MAGGEGSDEQRPDAGRWTIPLMIAATAVMAVSVIRHGGQGSTPPQPSPGDAPAAVATAGTGGPTAALPAPLPFSAPTEVRVPALGVDAPLTTVGPEPNGGIGAPPPADKNLAGWYEDGPAPGQNGTAVIDGHVDNARGPAVFYGLGALHRGNTVEVVRSDGRTAVFTVYGIQVFAKNAFPGDAVYGDKGAAELRVITCGGGFTKRTGYDSNVVVFARMTAVR